MKTTKLIVLAVLLITFGASLAAQAQDHPTQKEHPKKTEHPAKANDLVACASKDGEFKTFLTAVKAAGLAEKLQSEGPFTVFAPTDAAFAKLPAGTVEDLLKPANKAKLAGLLANHVVPGKIMAADIKTMKATNVNGEDLMCKVSDGAVTVNGAHVIKADLLAANGVIHAVDTVIMPAPPKDKAASGKPKDHPAH